MSKRLRILLYVLSVLILILLGLCFAVKIKSDREMQTAETALKTDGEGNGENTDEKNENETEAIVWQEDETESAAIDENESETNASESKDAAADAATGKTGVTVADDTAKKTGATSLFFGGDVLLGNAVLAKYDKGGITGILSEDLAELGENADICMVNEEFPFSTRGVAMEEKQFTFRTDPKRATILTELGVDVVSLANNHILDYGTDALLDTIVTLDEVGVSHVGAGQTISDAKQPVFLERNGQTFGFVGASRVWPAADWSATSTRPGVFGTYDATQLLEEIKEAKKQCDFLTVYVHWGLEYQAYPEDYERTLAADYIAAGADAVVGTHSHCLQGIEFIDGKPVFYSLGNYIFGMNVDMAATVMFYVGENGETSYRLLPAKSQNAYTESVDGQTAQNLYDYMEQISYNVTIDENGYILNRVNR